MTPETFLKEFGALAETSGGVAKLRGLVLDLAVLGKLIPKQRRDVPPEPLATSSAPKHSRKRQGTSTQVLPRPDCFPTNWHWTTLSLVTQQITDGEHQTPPRVERGVPLVTAKNVRGHGLDLFQTDFVEASVAAKCRKRCAPQDGDLLMVCVGATTGRLCVVRNPPKVVLVRSVALLRPDTKILSADFLAAFLRSTVGQRQVWSNVKQSAQPCLYLGRMSGIWMPVPPLAEQERIVAKVDQLMALCDELEARQTKRRKVSVRATKASLAALSEAQEPKVLRASWKRVSGHFDALFDNVENVGELRQAVLELAVRGRLVRQDARDEPAVPSVAGCPADVPFDCPQRWTWIRVSEAGDVKLGRQRSPKDHHGKNMVPYLRVANVHEDRLALVDVLEMNFTPEEQKTFALEPDDILLNEGQSYELVGRPAMYRGEISGICCFQNTLIRFRSYSNVVPEYALIVFRNYLHNGRFRAHAQQTTNIAHLSAGRLKEIEFPLPPLAEQHRIVAKVDQLMALCDDLEAKLKLSDERGQKLMKAVVEAMVA